MIADALNPDRRDLDGGDFVVVAAAASGLAAADGGAGSAAREEVVGSEGTVLGRVRL